MKKSIFILTLLLTTLQSEIPKNFSYIKEKIPTIELDIRYYSENNFIGTVIDGYLAPKAILSTNATLALTEVQK
jgi:D-alanyl-D-alanine dipeptidase